MHRPTAVATLAALASLGLVVVPTVAGGQSGTLQDLVNRLQCTPGYNWTAKYPRVLVPTEPIQRNENHTSRTQTATFISTRTRTAQRTLSAGVESEIGGGFVFLKASIKARFGIDVVASKTATLGNSQSVVVGPHRVAIGKYGVYKRGFAGFFVYPARPGHGGDLNRTCPRLRNVYIRATVPLDEVGWVIASVALP